MKIQDQHIDLIAAELSGNASTEESARLTLWLEERPEHRAYFEEMRSLWAASEQTTNSFRADVPAAWSRLEGRLDQFVDHQLTGHTPRGRFLSSGWWAAAATLALLLVAGWWFLQTGSNGAERIAIQTGPGEKLEHLLPDGSVVWLNANSSLAYVGSFDPRNIELQGEGYFDVEHNPERPFTVTSGTARTRVLGTSFNVRAYPNEDQIRVTVKSGRVKVESVAAEQEETLLTAGQEARLDKETQKLSDVEPASPNVMAWQSETLQFDDTALKLAIHDIETFYHTKIELASPELGNCPVNGSFPRDSVAALLRKITMTSGSAFEKIGDSWVISGPGCPE